MKNKETTKSAIGYVIQNKNGSFLSKFDYGYDWIESKFFGRDDNIIICSSIDAAKDVCERVHDNDSLEKNFKILKLLIGSCETYEIKDREDEILETIKNRLPKLTKQNLEVIRSVLSDYDVIQN